MTVSADLLASHLPSGLVPFGAVFALFGVLRIGLFAFLASGPAWIYT